MTSTKTFTLLFPENPDWDAAFWEGQQTKREDLVKVDNIVQHSPLDQLVVDCVLHDNSREWIIYREMVRQSVSRALLDFKAEYADATGQVVLTPDRLGRQGQGGRWREDIAICAEVLLAYGVLQAAGIKLIEDAG